MLLNKPYGVLCQFTDDAGTADARRFRDVPDVYPAGRLDADSEGLVVLTGNGRLQARIASRDASCTRPIGCRWKATPSDDALAALVARRRRCATAPARAIDARAIAQPAGLWPRDPPIRVRKAIPTAWLALTLDEGRNRQVRRMTAAVGLPTLRLVRWSVGAMDAATGSTPGQWRRRRVARVL